MFDWAKYKRTKGAIKLHLLLDHDGYLPSFAVVTEGKTSEIKVARTLRFDPGTILAIDRGYNDYEWFRELTIGRSLARYRHTPTRLQTPPFKPCVRFSRTRLTDDLLDVACVMPVPGRVLAFHRVVMPVVTAFANSRSRRTHLAHTHSRIVQLSRFIKGVVGHFWHALTLTSPPT